MTVDWCIGVKAQFPALPVSFSLQKTLLRPQLGPRAWLGNYIVISQINPHLMGPPSSSLYSGSLESVQRFSDFKFENCCIHVTCVFVHPVTMTTYFDPYRPDPESGIDPDPWGADERARRCSCAFWVWSRVNSVVHYRASYRGNMPILVGQTEPCEAENVTGEDAETSESTRSVLIICIIWQCS